MRPRNPRNYQSGNTIWVSDYRRYLFTSFACNMALPIFYLFVPLLAVQLGASVFELGLVGGAANAVYSFMPFVIGRFSDRNGARRFLVLASIMLLAAISILYAIVANPVYLIILRVFEGVGWAMLWPAIEVALTHNPARDARRTLSVFNLTWSLAAAIGPLLGAFVIFLTSIRFAFLLTTFGLVATLGTNMYPLLRGHWTSFQQDKENRDGQQSSTKLQARARKLVFDPAFYVISTSLGAVSSGVLFTFFPAYAKSLELSVLVIGVANFAYGFARFLIYFLSTHENIRRRLLDERRRLRTIILSLSVMSVASILFEIRDSTGLLYLLIFIVVGSGYSIVYAISQVALVAEATPERMGTGAGLFESSIGIGASIGPIAAGAISGSSITIPFFVPSLSLVSVLIFFFIYSRIISRTPIKQVN